MYAEIFTKLTHLSINTHLPISTKSAHHYSPAHHKDRLYRTFHHPKHQRIHCWWTVDVEMSPSFLSTLSQPVIIIINISGTLAKRTVITTFETTSSTTAEGLSNAPCLINISKLILCYMSYFQFFDTVGWAAGIRPVKKLSGGVLAWLSV